MSKVALYLVYLEPKVHALTRTTCSVEPRPSYQISPYPPPNYMHSSKYHVVHIGNSWGEVMSTFKAVFSE